MFVQLVVCALLMKFRVDLDELEVIFGLLNSKVCMSFCNYYCNNNYYDNKDTYVEAMTTFKNCTICM